MHLARKIKKLEMKNIQDVANIHSLSELLYEEWLTLKNKQIAKFKKTKKYNYFMCVQQAADEQIMIGLFCLLTQKILNFLNDEIVTR